MDPTEPTLGSPTGRFVLGLLVFETLEYVNAFKENINIYLPKSLLVVFKKTRIYSLEYEFCSRCTRWPRRSVPAWLGRGSSPERASSASTQPITWR